MSKAPCGRAQAKKSIFRNNFYVKIGTRHNYRRRQLIYLNLLKQCCDLERLVTNRLELETSSNLKSSSSLAVQILDGNIKYLLTWKRSSGVSIYVRFFNTRFITDHV